MGLITRLLRTPDYGLNQQLHVARCERLDELAAEAPHTVALIGYIYAGNHQRVQHAVRRLQFDIEVGAGPKWIAKRDAHAFGRDVVDDGAPGESFAGLDGA